MIVEANWPERLIRRKYTDDLLVLKPRQKRKVHTGEPVKAPGFLLAASCAGYDPAAEHDADITRPAVQGIQNTLWDMGFCEPVITIGFGLF